MVVEFEPSQSNESTADGLYESNSMTMENEVLELVKRFRLVAIIRLDELGQAEKISRALLAGGIALQEYTLTNPAALQVIADLRARVREFQSGEAAIGLGSVRNMTEAIHAQRCGAQFVVTPTLQLDVVRACRAANVPVMPGAYTPTEIVTAWDSGASFVKVFPARSLGPSYIKDVLAPMPYLKLMPTGGIDVENMSTYFKHGAAAVGVGGNLIDAQAVAAGNWDQVSSVASRYAQAAKATDSK